MEKKLLAVIFCATVILLFAGCRKKPASDSKLKDDLYSSDNFSYYSDQIGMKITDLEVIKRQTNTENQIDIVWVNVEASGDTAKGEMYYKMTYNLYNDGWLLEMIEDDNLDLWHFEPLCAPSDEEVESQLSYFGDHKILSEELDIENGLKTVTFEYLEEHENCYTDYTDQLIFQFENSYYAAGNGGPASWGNIIIPVDEKTYWNICGEYTRESDGAKYQITAFDVDGISSNTRDQTIRFSGHWENGETQEARVLPTRAFLDATSFAVTTGLVGVNNKDYCINNGYSVSCDNFNWEDVEYFTSSGFFIGPNAVYRFDDTETYRTDGDRTVHISVDKMIAGARTYIITAPVL